MDTLRAPPTLGALRLLCDDLGFSPELCGSRNGRGPDACLVVAGGIVADDDVCTLDDNDACPIDACADPLEDAESVRVRSRGNGRLVCAAGVLRLDLEGTRRAVADSPFADEYDHDPTASSSSSPTGVSGIATLDPDTLDGVATPGSSRTHSTDVSRM